MNETTFRSLVGGLIYPTLICLPVCRAAAVVGVLVSAVLLRVTVSLTQPRHPGDNDTFGVISSLLHVYACVVQQVGRRSEVLLARSVIWVRNVRE